MPMQLRKRLVCHYCGQKSSQSKHEAGRFKCEHCLAVNHLDENGEITDVPHEELNTPKQSEFKRPFQATNVFCSRCIQNQYMYNTKLSDYLPDPDDPEYEIYEARLPAYKKELEERFPQCCAQCEPRVRAQLQKTTYNARTDHMRRMLEQSRTRRIGSRLGWRSLLINMAALGYSMSLAIQLVWHALGSQKGFTSGSCLQWPVPERCVGIFQQYVGPSLALGLFCLWWNPKWHHKLQGREGRLVGLDRYYAVQGLVLLIRFGVWVAVDFVPTTQQIHTVALISIILLSGYALQSIAVDTTALVNWDFQVPQLTSEKQYIPPSLPVEALSFDSFAPAPTLEPWQPPTPPIEEDAMDWTPSQSFEQPKQPRFRNIGPSPFHGTLPALSKGNVKNGLKESRQAIGLPPGHFDKRDRLPAKEERIPAMAEPKFFPQSVDTGLENIFDSVFSLKDDTVKPEVTIRTPQHDVRVEAVSVSKTTADTTVPLFRCAFLMIVLLMWLVSNHLMVAFPNIQLIIMACGAVLPCVRLATDTRMPFAALLAMEVAGLAFLMLQIWTCSGLECVAYGKVVTGLLLTLIVQEVAGLFATKSDDTSQDTSHTERVPFESTPRPVQRKASTETMFSTTSVDTTSTASAWKTPKLSAREVDRGMGMKGLSLGDSYGGYGITPRRR